MAGSKLDVALDTDGHHVGALRVDLAVGAIAVPVVVLRNGEGPRTLLTGGIHGDEYEGPIALRYLSRELDWRAMRGRLVICPIANPKAMAADRRRAPDDNLDLNRSFPGDAAGSYTQRLAAAIAQHLVPTSDQVIDCHTGGSDTSMIPSAMIHQVPDRDTMQRSLEIVRGMRCPAGIVIDESEKNGTMFDDFVEAAGKPFVSCEFGGTLTTPETIAIARQSVLNGLATLGHFEADRKTPAWRGERIARMLESPSLDYQCLSPVRGLLEPMKDIADPVAEGETLALIHALDDPAKLPVPVPSPKSGFVFYRSSVGMVGEGEELAMIARNWQGA